MPSMWHRRGTLCGEVLATSGGWGGGGGILRLLMPVNWRGTAIVHPLALRHFVSHRYME